MSLAQRSHLQAVRDFHIAKGDILLAAGEGRAADHQYDKALHAQQMLAAGQTS